MAACDSHRIDQGENCPDCWATRAFNPDDLRFNRAPLRQARRQYGYGPGDDDRPSVIGFDTLQEAIRTAEQWLKERKVWGDNERRYVVKVYRSEGSFHWTCLSSVVGLNLVFGGTVTSVWYDSGRSVTA